VWDLYGGAKKLDSELSDLYRRTRFEEDLSGVSSNVESMSTILEIIQKEIQEKQTISIMTTIDLVFRHVDEMENFLLKYSNFLRRLDEKFGTEFSKSGGTAMNAVTEMKTSLHQIQMFIARKDFAAAESIAKTIRHGLPSLISSWENTMTIPHVIDYGKLSNEDWKMVGVAGIHYRSTVFLSYPFKDTNPKEDQNQRFIDDYIIPLLELLNLKPVTARGSLKTEELIDDRISELINNCDGIIGFYTSGDSVENVEHELSKNSNIVALCKEDGAKIPSMRLARLMINFSRDRVGDLFLELIQVLKDKRLFALVV
jgi:hypothetical protein